MRDQLQEAIDVATLDNLTEQRRLAIKQRELEPWKIVISSLAVGAILGGAIGASLISTLMQPAPTMSPEDRAAIVEELRGSETQ